MGVAGARVVKHYLVNWAAYAAGAADATARHVCRGAYAALARYTLASYGTATARRVCRGVYATLARYDTAAVYDAAERSLLADSDRF